MKSYKEYLLEDELTPKSIPKPDRFDMVENRLFYYLMPFKSKKLWHRTSQGRYNWMLANGYTVSYVDNAIIDQNEA